jgi:gluconate 2-dehydrogenase gamma chain
MKRREFIDLSGMTVGGLLLEGVAGKALAANAQAHATKVPMRFLTGPEGKVIVAACERIFPADESGPGAIQANVVVYIDHQLAGPYGTDKHRYLQPPFVQSIPEHGYQGQENPQQIYRAGIKTLGTDFAGLEGPQQDERLARQERTLFFQLLRQHTLEGMFCDPMHGGNAGMVGWQLIGYPGPQMSFRGQVDHYNGVAYRAAPQSLAQIMGHPVKPWEDPERA